MNKRSFLLLLALLAVPACRSGSFQSAPLPPQDVAVSDGLTRIYVARDSQARGKVRAIRVSDGEREIGVIGSDEYLCWDRLPGRTLLSFIYEGPAIDGGNLEGLLSLEAERGQTYYVQVYLERKSEDPELRARSGRPEATLLTAEEGKAMIGARHPVR